MPLDRRLEAWFGLWKVSDSASDLEEAATLVRFLRDNAPEEYRESMIANVPLYRELLEAARTSSL